MSDVVRLALVSHGSTEAIRTARFPDDEPLDDVGVREAGKRETMTADRVLVAPEARAAQTASLLGLHGESDPELRDIWYGTWRGLGMTDVAPEQLSTWLTDPDAAPHGGESIAVVIERVRTWLAGVAGLGGSTIVVTHPAVIRAVVLIALDAPPISFWRIDIPPLSVTRLHYRNAWTLRSTGYDYPKLTP